jgi:hypothetical protein
VNKIAKKRTRSKYHVDITEQGKKNRTYKGILFDSKTEMLFLVEVIEKGIESGEISSYERQVPYILQEGFTRNGKKILPIKYVADFVIHYSNGETKVFDTKGMPDAVSLIKRKMHWIKYPELNLTYICRNLKFGGETGWIEYDKLKKLRNEEKKGNKNK